MLFGHIFGFFSIFLFLLNALFVSTLKAFQIENDITCDWTYASHVSASYEISLNNVSVTSPMDLLFTNA